MTEIQDFTLPSSDQSQQFAVRVWLPEGTPRAVVQIVHGIAEYIRRYDTFARFLNDHGILVCGEDHLGHGATVDLGGKLGWFGPKNGWMTVVDNVYAVRQTMGERYPGVPYFLMGHSMGSFLTRTYLCRYPGTIDGAILSGTGQESPGLIAFGKALSSTLSALRGSDHVSRMVHDMSMGSYNKQFAPNRTTADWITRDESVVDRYIADPLCQFIPTVGLYRDMMGGLQYIAKPENLSKMDPDTPVYLFSGAQDPVGSNGEGVKKVHGFFQSAGTRDLELKLYPGGRHEMLNELNRQEVYDDVLSWLDRHITPAQNHS